MLFCDNGSEFSSHVMDLWAYHNQLKIDFFRPGKPTDNAQVESFNGTLRAECLDAHWFSHLPEAAERIEAWRWEYNASRPHSALGERTPHEFARHIAASRDMSRLGKCRRLTLDLLQKEGSDQRREVPNSSCLSFFEGTSPAEAIQSPLGNQRQTPRPHFMQGYTLNEIARSWVSRREHQKPLLVWIEKLRKQIAAKLPLQSRRIVD